MLLLSLAAAGPLALPLENTRVDVLITGPQWSVELVYQISA